MRYMFMYVCICVCLSAGHGQRGVIQVASPRSQRPAFSQRHSFRRTLPPKDSATPQPDHDDGRALESSVHTSRQPAFGQPSPASGY